MEFRCFVKDKNLIGISQRDITSYYEFLNKINDEGQNTYNERIKNKIREFYQ